MGFLEDLDEIEGHIFWFYRQNDGGLTPRIKALLEKFNGFAVAIPSFDDLMIQIGNKLELERLDEKIEQIAKQRAKNYREQIEKITEEKATPKETKDAVGNMVARGKKDWWYYEVEASKEEDLTKRDEIYREGIKQLSKSAEIHNQYALFLKNIQKDYDQAETMYKKAIELDPKYATCINNYAVFLSDIRKDYDQAETFYKKAIELDPEKGTTPSNYGIFLASIRKDYDQAETFYKKAIELDPEKGTTLNNYATLLSSIRKDYVQAETLYQKAIELDPKDAYIIGNYAKHLIVKKDLKKAKLLIQKAFELNQNRYEKLDLSLWFYRYAFFFDEYNEAEKSIETLLEKSITYPGKYLDDVLAMAKELGHPDYDKLCEFEKKITAV